MTGLDTIRKHEFPGMSLINSSDLDQYDSLLFDGSSSYSMEEEMTMMSMLHKDIFDDPWNIESSKLNSTEFNQGMELIRQSRLSPIYLNEEGDSCLTMELHILSGLEILRGWKREVCLNEVCRDSLNPWNISLQPIGENEKELGFTNWSKRYGVDTLSLPWKQLFGRSTFNVLANLWNEVRIIIKGRSANNETKHVWSISNDGETLVKVSLWKD